MSDASVVALITAVIGPALLAIINHLLKQRDDERRETRRVITALRAQRDMYRARSARLHRLGRPPSRRSRPRRPRP